MISGKQADYYIDRIVVAANERDAMSQFLQLILTAIKGEENPLDGLHLLCSCDHANSIGEECACDDD